MDAEPALHSLPRLEPLRCTRRPRRPRTTLSVDDDRQDCTAAGYTSIQDAIDAAAPGDTIAICPGRYVEGNGAANSNGITVDKSLTLKGAGADLVTISPRRYDGNDGVIAEDPQSIRYPRGNIITAVGTPALPLTVDISGVTVDGNGVAAKAGSRVPRRPGLASPQSRDRCRDVREPGRV